MAILRIPCPYCGQGISFFPLLALPLLASRLRARNSAMTPQFLCTWRKQATPVAGVRVEDSSVFGVDTEPRGAASYAVLQNV